MTEPLIPPAFRKDLKLYPGPKESDGSPTYNLYDPVRARYFKFSWEESLIYKLARPGMSFDEIAVEVKNYAPVEITADDVQHFFHQAAYLGLLNIPRGSEQVYSQYEKGKGSFFWWLIMHYLYLRIPLIHPDAFLERTLPKVMWLWSRTAIIIYTAVTLLGLALVTRQFSEYLHTFTYFFTFQGLIAYGLAIFVVKFIHEFSHAYTAKYYGVNVSTMGVALIVLWPVLYTDVTDSWKLKKRSERLFISMAGVVAEIVIAGLSTMGWILSPPGIWRSVFFILSTVTWISSVFVNCNPIMRFDGYYMLCDLWGIDNLRPRAFAVAKWQMREWLYGLKLPCPEGEGADPKMLRWMCVYGYISWVYFLTLYTVVALFVYYKFTKALGIILFFLEIAIFFVWPVISEVQELYKLRRHFNFNKRLLVTLSVFTLLFFWAVLPLPHTESFSGITLPVKFQTLYVPAAGLIEKIYGKRGEVVKAGEPIIKVWQLDIEKEIYILENEIRLLNESMELIHINPEFSSLLPQKEAELASVKAKLQSYEYLRDQMTLKADIPGVIYDWDDTLKVGQSIAKDQVIGKIADTRVFIVMAYIPESKLNTVKVGEEADFHLPFSPITFRGKVDSIDEISEGLLEYPPLASVFKGPLPVVVTPAKELKLTQSYYKMRVIFTSKDNTGTFPFDKVGDVRVSGESYSILVRTLVYLYGLFIRESSI